MAVVVHSMELGAHRLAIAPDVEVAVDALRWHSTGWVATVHRCRGRNLMGGAVQTVLSDNLSRRPSLYADD